MEEDFKPLHGDEPFHFTLGKQEVNSILAIFANKFLAGC
jgi:hypothetical protein